MIVRRRVERRRGGEIRVRLPFPEQELLRELAGELDELLRSGSEHDDVRRLFPPAYADSEQDEAEYRDLVREELLEGRREALRAFETTIDRSRLSEDELDVWMRVLNDLRLVLGTRLDVTEDTFVEPIDRRDPDAQTLAVYAYLGWLQEQVVQATRVAGS
ncbi:MAG: DUF2017 family protein [Gaiellales bacterium]